MSDQLSISLNIVIPKDITSKISKVQEQLNSSFSELRKYDPSGHISVLNKFMYEEDIDQFVSKVKEYFSNFKPFRIKFDKFGKAGNKYIFVYLDNDSTKIITTFHGDLMRLTKNIGNETWNNKDNAYDFIPHISVIKLDPSVIDEALITLDDINFDFDFFVSALEVSIEIKENGTHKGFNKDTIIRLI